VHQSKVLRGIVDLSMVKELNWCKFVVEQLQDAAKKMDKKNSVRGLPFPT